MYWLQDVIVFILFPYLLPSPSPSPSPLYDCLPRKEFKPILEYLLMSFCNLGLEETQDTLKMFIKTLLPSSHKTSLDDNLSFLGDITQQCSFQILSHARSEAHCLYGCSLLIENKANIHVDNDVILRRSSYSGYKDVVALLLKHKADVHAECEYSLRFSSYFGYKDIVALLLQHYQQVE
jgi:hypothetical protein